MAETQESNPVIGLPIRPFKQGLEHTDREVETWPTGAKMLWQARDRLRLFDGVVHRRWDEADNHVTSWQLVVPATCTGQYIGTVHNTPSGDHLSRMRTLAMVQRDAYWPTWQSDVKKYIRQCSCATERHRNPPPRRGYVRKVAVVKARNKPLLSYNRSHQPSSVDRVGPRRRPTCVSRQQ